LSRPVKCPFEKEGGPGRPARTNVSFYGIGRMLFPGSFKSRSVPKEKLALNVSVIAGAEHPPTSIMVKRGRIHGSKPADERGGIHPFITIKVEAI